MAAPRYGSPGVDPAPLFEPLTYSPSGRTAPNRFLKAATSERLASWDPKDESARGIPSKQLINLYRSWGAGGWGQILTGNIAIDAVHLEAAGNTIIKASDPFEGPRFEAFKELAAAGKENGSLLIGQVTHAGRQVESWIQPNPISASAVPLKHSATGRTYGEAREATKEDIASIIEGFAHAAEYLEKAGFDGLELHGAHGYLIAQFLSPRTNKRTDEYGGNLENRSRIVFEIASEIRKRVSPKFMLGIKINSVEYQPEGITLDDVKEFSIALENAHFDFIEISGGNYEKLAFKHVKEENKKRENYFLTQAEEIVKSLKGETRMFSTGGFKTTAGLVNSLATLDGVGIGRAACQEPGLPNAIKNEGATGVLKQAFDEEGFQAMALVFVLINQIANGLRPADFSLKENVDEAWEKAKQHMQRVAEDKEHYVI
ncbi:hypothetical protein CEP51_002524 [Fusarium floridanum]|uniref:NADH:flavin oxidoreductase/NADH oxidase N-terminal domain-containing protein n=1 Tax=Fusarium floridanum TaxID=1325733 RepID=A0A428SAX1_9HYPO|nr:hypothetical protein CEP51_002524 [Fusarium floridanum]